MSRKSLAVIGGGAAGHKIAHELRHIFDVTLIDPKTYWEVPMALPRLLVEPSSLPARLSYASFLPGVRHVQGRAVRISEREVLVAANGGSERIAFDYAVIATGSRYIDPLIKAEVSSEAERSAQVLTAHERLKRSSHVVIAGGGAVGVETAAELRHAFPQLKVTLVHSAPRLLGNAPSKFGGWAERELISLGVELELDDLVVSPAIGEQPVDGQVLTRKGRLIDADAVVWAAGTRPNTEFVAESWPHLVQDNGLVRTDSYLRLQGLPHIFVAGDVTNLPEGRLAITASFHVPSIVDNLKVLANDAGARQELKPYVPKLPGKGMGKMMIVTLGRRDGLTSLPFGQFRASFLARKIKSDNMFVAQYRKAVGLDR